MRWLAAMFLICLGAGPATAQPSSDSPTLAQHACAAGEARPATIETIAALGDRAIGACFTVEAIATGFWLYADNAARYRPSSAENDPSASGAIIGLYGRSRGLPPARIRVTGRIDRCERIREVVTAGGGIPFLSGYCHYHRGLALYGQAVEELEPVAFTRVGLRDAGNLGNLRPLAQGPVRQRLLAAASAFFDALDSGDDALLHGLVAQSRQQQEDQLSALMAHPAVAQWRSDRTGRVLQVLGWQRPADASGEQQAQWARDAAQGAEAYVCSAGPAFAERNLWPIHFTDTGIAAERPYLCIRIWMPDGQPPAYSFGIERQMHSVAREPAH